MPVKVSLGFRVKSGFAIAVALTGTAAAPVALARRIVLLSDPDVAETKQPYHDGFGTAQEDLNVIARLTKIVAACATHSIADLLADPRLEGRTCRAAGLVVGSVIDPAAVGNPHIRAHASEGRLFRTVLEDALRARGVTCTILVEKSLGTRASKALGCAASKIKKTVVGFGPVLHGPWRAEVKAAATAAWMVL